MRLTLEALLLAFTVFFNSVELSSQSDPPGSPPPPEISTGSSPYVPYVHSVHTSSGSRGGGRRVPGRADAPIELSSGPDEPVPLELRMLSRLDSRRSVNFDPDNKPHQGSGPVLISGSSGAQSRSKSRSKSRSQSGSRSRSLSRSQSTRSSSPVPVAYALPIYPTGEESNIQYTNPIRLGGQAPYSANSRAPRRSRTRSPSNHSPTRSSGSSSSNEYNYQGQSSTADRSRSNGVGPH